MYISLSSAHETSMAKHTGDPFEWKQLFNYTQNSWRPPTPLWIPGRVSGSAQAFLTKLNSCIHSKGIVCCNMARPSGVTMPMNRHSSSCSSTGSCCWSQ